MKAKFLILVLVVAALSAGCFGDENSSASQADEILANTQLEIYQAGQPVPIYDYSQVRDTLIQIQGLLIEGRTGYSTIVNEFTGAPLFQCPTIGFPIPADTQVTNPSQVVGSPKSRAVIGQIEPNGTFTSQNTAGTYLLCAGDNGKAIPVYSEPAVIASGAPLIWDAVSQTYKLDDGAPSMVVIIDN